MQSHLQILKTNKRSSVQTSHFAHTLPSTVMICSTLLTLTQPSGLSQLKCHFLLKLLLTSTTGLGVSSVLPKHPMLHTHYTHEICLFISLSLQRILAIGDCVLYTDISLVPHMCLTPRYLFKIDNTRGTSERLPAKQLHQP